MTAKRLVVMLGCATLFAGCDPGSHDPPDIGPGHRDDGNGTGDDGPWVGESGPAPQPNGPRGPQPSFGTTVTLSEAPPPISGGTLTVTTDGIAVAADPDRDKVYLVRLSDRSVTKIELPKHDEPGRVALDDAGRAHVVLRGAGAIATIDIATGALVARRDVCPAPRGITFDAARARMLVACAGGEFVALGPAPEMSRAILARVDDDLRDVIVIGDDVFVSRFRTSEVLRLSADGQVLEHRQAGMGSQSASFAWRMIADAAGAAAAPLVLNQMLSAAPLSPAPGGYGDSVDACNGKASVMPTLSRTDGSSALLPAQAAVPVDVARTAGGFAIVAAGNGHTHALPQVYLVSNTDQAAPCNSAVGYGVTGQATAVAEHDGNLIVQSREPAQLEFLQEGFVIRLDDTSREDTGHAIFHANSGVGLACASCHGEGGDDAHTWSFVGIGERRTPSLRGTLKDTAPYHWNGEMRDIAVLAADVMTSRMNGPTLDSGQSKALESWLFELPAPIASNTVDVAAAVRGKQLFESSSVGCAGCHSGARFTNSATVDVGTQGLFQVPSLVGLSTHAPYLHDGCATTLKERFSAACSSDKHGSTSQLSGAQIDDLVAYLGTL